MPAKVFLIAGPARCGKTHRLFDRYIQRLAKQRLAEPQNGPCCWLAPNQVAVAQLQDSLLDGTTAFLQPNLRTFASFAEMIIASSERLIRPISATQKRRLLQQILQSASKQRKLDHFARVASTPGFVIQVAEFISEQKRTDVWPEDFARQCDGPRGSRRNRELSLLYTAYQEQLLRGDLYDSEGRFWAARGILAASVASSSTTTQTTRHQFDLVVVNGFNDFTAAQYDILRLLGQCSSELLISLTYETTKEATKKEGSRTEGDLFAKTEQTLSRLQEIFPQLEIENLPAPPLSGHSLQTLQHQLFREKKVFRETKKIKSESGGGKAEIDGVEILAANSELGEVEAVAERIKGLLHSRRALPEEIVVVSRGGESTTALVDAVFPDFGIPYASETRPRLESEPLVRALQTLIRLHQEDWPFQTLLDVVNNQLFSSFDAEADLANFATQPRVAVEQCLRSAQLPTGREALLEQLEFRRDVAAPEEGAAIDRRTAEVAMALRRLRWLDYLLASLPAKASIDTWTQTIQELLTQLGILAPKIKTKHRSRSAIAWNQLRRSLREIAQVEACIAETQSDETQSKAKPKAITLTELQELIAAVAREQRVPAAHDATGRVRILSAESARKLSIKHLFLMGLGERAFFSGAPAEPLAEPGGEQPATELPATELAAPDIRRGEVMLLFYELVTRPNESLTLSYPALDGKGQPMSPSPLLVELERSAGEGCIARTTMSLGQVAAADATPHSVSSFRRQAVAQAVDGKERWLAGMISHPNHVRTGSSILNGIDCVAERSVRDIYGPHEGLLLSDVAQAALAQRFDAEFMWSPSRLEGYAACPFRYFSEQILRLEPLKELSLRNDPRRRGSLLHEVLATIHEQLKDEDVHDSEAQELVERFLTTLDAAVKSSPLRGIAQSLREIERREIEAWAPSYAEQETSYRDLWKHLDQPPRPAHFEVRFGPETRHSKGETADPASTTLPFELDLGDEKICLTGAIDRVDIGSVGGVTVFNIIDYKSGKAVKLSLDKVRSGHQLQLPLYALAAEQLLLAGQNAVALATGYWNIQSNGFVNKKGGALQIRELTEQTLKPSSDWKKLQPDILIRVQELIAGMRDGHFPVYNQDEQCTRSCSLSTVCRVGQIRSLEKAWPVEEKENSPTSKKGEPRP